MATLLMRLQGPMQSWGTTSRFDERDTQLEPSKSGVLGLVCAALGRDRSEPLEDLASLRMGVRVDREGIPLRDYQTATGVLVASGKADPRRTVVSPRHYLADAVFLVGLEGRDQALLERIQQALRAPFWPLCLGRKSFVPGSPVWLPEGLSSLALEQALQAWPRLAEAQPGDRGKPLRCLIEDERSGVVRLDQPIAPLPNAVSAHASYARESRMYLTRLTPDPRSAQARRDPGDAYEMHRTLSRVFADEQAPASRFLWRLEASGMPGPLRPCWSRRPARVTGRCCRRSLATCWGAAEQISGFATVAGKRYLLPFQIVRQSDGDTPGQALWAGGRGAATGLAGTPGRAARFRGRGGPRNLQRSAWQPQGADTHQRLARRVRGALADQSPGCLWSGSGRWDRPCQGFRLWPAEPGA